MLACAMSSAAARRGVAWRRGVLRRRTSTRHLMRQRLWSLVAFALLASAGGAYTDGLVGWFDYSTFDATSLSWTDKSSAGANGTGSTGVAATTDATGAAGNSCAVTYVAGSSSKTIMFSPAITVLPMSICTVRASVPPAAMRTRLMRGRTAGDSLHGAQQRAHRAVVPKHMAAWPLAAEGWHCVLWGIRLCAVWIRPELTDSADDQLGVPVHKPCQCRTGGCHPQRQRGARQQRRYRHGRAESGGYQPPKLPRQWIRAWPAQRFWLCRAHAVEPRAVD